MANKKEEEEKLSFEESLERLEDIVKKLEVGDIPLDDAIEEVPEVEVKVEEEPKIEVEPEPEEEIEKEEDYNG